MSELFIGTDIVSVSRINDILKSSFNNRFKARTFTDAEIIYCDKKPSPAVHYAGRFAAKEAIKKALLSSGIISNISLDSIEILPQEGGAPVVNFQLQKPFAPKCKVSISHTDETAIAFAMVELQ